MKDLEENKVQRELMSEEEFEEHIHNRIMPLHLVTYEAVRKYSSVRRSLKRGHVTSEGIIMPSRPFNNKKNSCKRDKHSKPMNEEKKRVYATIKDYRRRHADD
jgi:hypothetical protein